MTRDNWKPIPLAAPLTWTPEQIAWTRAQLARLPNETQDAYELDALTLLSVTLPELLNEVEWLQEQLAMMMLVGKANADVAHEALGDAPAAQAALRRAEQLHAMDYKAELRAKGRLYQHHRQEETTQP